MRVSNLKVAFFDRDGTIIEDYPDQEWANVKRPVFLTDSIETLKSVRKKGYEIIIITNQYLINEGFILKEQYKEITVMMLNELARHNVEVLDIFYCPHKRNEGCTCIKPQTGMISDALKRYPNININDSFIVGDSPEDIELAINMKMKGFGIGVGSTYCHETIYEIKRIKELLTHL